MSWQDDPNGFYIRMHSGRKFYLVNPPPEQWHIPDVAYHAAGVNRYTGASRFTIGQHMVVGSRMAERFYPEHPLLPARFLIHDAPEVVYNDMNSPLKRLCPDYCRLLTDGEHSFEKRCDLTWMDDPLVKEVDVRMWLTERLMVYRDAEQAGVDMADDYNGPLEPFPLSFHEPEEEFGYWHPEKVEAEWLEAFHRLLPWVEI